MGPVLGLFDSFLLGHLRSCTPASKHLRYSPNSPEDLHERLNYRHLPDNQQKSPPHGLASLRWKVPQHMTSPDSIMGCGQCSPPAFKGQMAILCSRGDMLGISSGQCHSEGRQPSLTLLVDPVSWNCHQQPQATPLEPWGLGSQLGRRWVLT